MLRENESFLYIFSWTQKGGQPGFGLYKFNDDTGEMTLIRMLNETLSCGNAVIDAERGILYCCVDTDKHQDLRAGGGGCLYSFKLDPETGDAVEMNHVSSYCPNPSFASIDEGRKFLAVSMHSTMDSVTRIKKDAFGKAYIQVEYSDAGVGLFSLKEDGSIGELLDINVHTGCGPTPRQLHAHAHCAVLSPSGNLLASCDKGNDGVHMYRIDREKNRLILNGGAPYQNRPGTAPRYCAFHPTRPFFFHNNEMKMEIDIYRYNEKGDLEHLETVRALPEDCVVMPGERGGQQDFQLTPDGRFLYTMMHGRYNGISVFEVDQNTGKLTLIQHVPVPGVWARAFAFSPDRRHLAAVCLTSGDVSSYAVGDDGKLTSTGFMAVQSAANAALFYKP